MLQSPFEGTFLQHLTSFWQAVWRLRCILQRGLRFHSFDEIVLQARQIIQDPWITSRASSRCRRDRRGSRVQPPQDLPGWHVYYSDGASRTAHADGRVGSCGALLQVDGHTISEVAIFLGDVTNNVAEYEGVLCSLRHAMTSDATSICIRVDSMLVCQQLNGSWACKSPDLTPCYTLALQLLQILRTRTNTVDVRVQHVFPEYNSNADSLANYAIDNVNDHSGGRSVVMISNWPTRAI